MDIYQDSQGMFYCIERNIFFSTGNVTTGVHSHRPMFKTQCDSALYLEMAILKAGLAQRQNQDSRQATGSKAPRLPQTRLN